MLFRLCCFQGVTEPNTEQTLLAGITVSGTKLVSQSFGKCNNKLFDTLGLF
jgi:hypothetical protein